VVRWERHIIMYSAFFHVACLLITLRHIATKLTHYPFDIVGHMKLGYKAIPPCARRIWYG
jgi:hypothetical protein